MRVGGAAEPGVAEVPVAVERLLERAQHERCIRLQPMPAPLGLGRDQATCLAGEDAGLARLELVRKRRSGHVERRELLDHERHPLRIGLLVDPVQGGDATLLQ
jgi:hypothetical protein